MLVDGAMTRAVVTVDPSDTIRQAAARMRERRVGCVVVAQAGLPGGVLTESDIVRLVASGADLDRMRVAEAMSSPVVTVEPGASLDAAAELMRARNLKRLVVVLGSDIRGVLTVRDVAYAQPEIARAYLNAMTARPED
ncbi:MAG TPA: CBS domain-containing protein [Candidatus Thermoplasmatota archaeon]|nr:CBS domain-containing protein [Candidatus Thermoplasmatota archaeon]